MALRDKRFEPRPIADQLHDCTTIKEMLDCLDANYDLASVKPGFIDKPMLVNSLVKLLKTYNVRPK